MEHSEVYQTNALRLLRRKLAKLELNVAKHKELLNSEILKLEKFYKQIGFTK
jgi:hypothetical protein